jgi:hypothetical protein
LILLTTNQDAVNVTLGNAQTIQVQCSYVDLGGSGSTVTPGRVNTIVYAASTFQVLGGPATGNYRTVKFMSMYNAGTSSNTVQVVHTDGANKVTLQDPTINNGYSLTYNDGQGWQMMDGSGNLQQSMGTGRLLKLVVLTSTATTGYTTGGATNTVHLKAIAAGGGGSGSYSEWFGTVIPATGYTYICGAGGTGVSAANGNPGGNTSITIGGATILCTGGSGGLVGSALAVDKIGGAGGAIATGGTFNITGNQGIASGNGAAAADNISGKGADSQLGSGGPAAAEAAATTGAAGTGYGSGGAGGTTTGSATLGGAGAPGVILIEEYS